MNRRTPDPAAATSADSAVPADLKTSPGVAAALADPKPGTTSPLPDARAAPAPPGSPSRVWLTTDASALGPAGSFVEMSEAEAKTHDAGLLIRPTADQLALRPR